MRKGGGEKRLLLLPPTPRAKGSPSDGDERLGISQQCSEQSLVALLLFYFGINRFCGNWGWRGISWLL